MLINCISTKKRIANGVVSGFATLDKHMGKQRLICESFDLMKIFCSHQFTQNGKCVMTYAQSPYSSEGIIVLKLIKEVVEINQV